tara:strand:- start:83850 stop:84449 length:600 start_codon:yes stop_codon:yes gene_type:complete
MLSTNTPLVDQSITCSSISTDEENGGVIFVGHLTANDGDIEYLNIGMLLSVIIEEPGIDRESLVHCSSIDVSMSNVGGNMVEPSSKNIERASDIGGLFSSIAYTIILQEHGMAEFAMMVNWNSHLFLSNSPWASSNDGVKDPDEIKPFESNTSHQTLLGKTSFSRNPLTSTSDVEIMPSTKSMNRMIESLLSVDEVLSD